MQGKGVIKFFLIVMTLVALIQYLFIIPTNKVEADAEEYALNFGNPDGSPEERADYKECPHRFSGLNVQRESILDPTN